MNKFTFRSTLLASLVLVAGGASAATYTNVPGGADTGSPFAYFGNAANPRGDSPAVGEVFSVSSGSSLSALSFYAIGNVTQSLQLNLAVWNPDTNAKNQATNTIGPSVLAGSAVETFNSTAGYTTLAFNNLSLSLIPNIKYVAYLTSSDATATGIQLSRTQTTNDASGFGIGNAYLSTVPGTGWQLPFNGNGFLSLEYTAVVAAVPETDGLFLGLAGFGFVGAIAKRLRRKAG